MTDRTAVELDARTVLLWAQAIEASERGDQVALAEAEREQEVLGRHRPPGKAAAA